MISQHPLVHHDGSRRYVRPESDSSPSIGSTVRIRIRVWPHEGVQRVFLRFTPDGEQRFIEMTPIPGVDATRAAHLCAWWEATLPVVNHNPCYRFLLTGKDGSWWYTTSGLSRNVPTDERDFILSTTDHGPRWAQDAVFYQIVPDRFMDGDPSSNVRDDEFTYRGQPSRAKSWEEPVATDWSHAHLEFYGGDLQGIASKLDYIADLGATAVYLNPVFPALSSHHYDVIDYRRVDPHLGGDKGLALLRRELSRRDMRLLLDIVPNHCGIGHSWFTAAQADASSPEAEFFFFERHPDRYLSWMGHETLPKLNYRSQRLRDEMYAGPDSVFRRWLREPFGIDGWRIDVANMLGIHGGDDLSFDVVSGIAAAARAENPDVYLVGEHFFDGSKLVGPGGFNAVMNYAGFAEPLWAWLVPQRFRQHFAPQVIETGKRITTEALAATWLSFLGSVPWPVVLRQMNALGTHDTPRIRTRLHDDATFLQAAFIVLAGFPGVPSILYGDEIGLEGEGISVVRPMTWAMGEQDLLSRDFLRRLIGIRRRHPALREGGFAILHAADDTMAFLRDTDDEQAIVIASRSGDSAGPLVLPVGRCGIADGVVFEHAFAGMRITVREGHLELPPASSGGAIWVGSTGR